MHKRPKAPPMTPKQLEAYLRAVAIAEYIRRIRAGLD